MNQPVHPYSWMNPDLVVRDTHRYGLGVFARRAIPKNEMLFVCGGPILTLHDEDHLPFECANMPIEISDSFSMGPRNASEIPLMPQHYVNHSCAPNAGWHGQLFLVAMRDITKDEEVCYDYAMIMQSNKASGSYWTMPCCCGSPRCRKNITEDDWLLPELQERYDGWFAWHNQQIIDAKKRELPKRDRRGVMFPQVYGMVFTGWMSGSRLANYRRVDGAVLPKWAFQKERLYSPWVVER